VLTDYVLELYAKWFCDSTRNITTKIFNATSDGMLLDEIPSFTLMPDDAGAEAGLKNITGLFSEKNGPDETHKIKWAETLAHLLGSLLKEIFYIIPHVRSELQDIDTQKEKLSPEQYYLDGMKTEIEQFINKYYFIQKVMQKTEIVNDRSRLTNSEKKKKWLEVLLKELLELKGIFFRQA